MREVIARFRREFLFVAGFSAVANLLMLTPSIYMLQVFDRVMLSKSELTLVAVSAIALFLFAVLATTDWARSQLLVRVGVRLDAALGERVFTAALNGAVAGTQSNPAKALGELATLRQFLTGAGIFAIFDAPWTPLYLAVLFLLHPVLGGVATAFAVVLAAAAYLGHRLTRETTKEALQHAASVDAYLHAKLRNADVIQALGMLGQLRERWTALQQALLGAAERSQEHAGAAQALSKFLRYSAQSLMLGTGALLVIRGEMTVGGMIAANLLMARALAPIDQITASWRGFATAREAWQSLQALLPARAAPASAREPGWGTLRVERLSLATPDETRTILEGIDAELPAGESVAIIGPSGAGKSTLARALVGVWPRATGQIWLAGEPLETWGRTQFGYLPQEVELLPGTIAENIARFGELAPARIVEAAKRAGIHDMVLRFPAGYDTPVGESGEVLSAGQRQRIALARALYGTPALVVLDEPDANLDEAGVTALADAVRQLKAMGKTVVMVTHRMNLVGLVDRVLLLAGGRVRMYGPRAEVLAALSPA